MVTSQSCYDTSTLLSLYLHIPFCQRRCSYCAFNTYAGLEALVPFYVDALCRELAWYGEQGGRPGVHSVYFGGGTPSLLPANDLVRILVESERAFALVPGLEVTLEANPGTVQASAFQTLRQAGVTRLSLGAQSAQAADLRLFRRSHDWRAVVQTVHMARRAGFDNISLDLIYGAPGQDMAGWRRTLRAALALAPEHVSLYSLCVESGTLLHEWVGRGVVGTPDPDLAADMYDQATERLAQHGYAQYELSNWARPGYLCRHNLQYWRNESYLGIGAGAHGHVGDLRYAAVASPREYVRRLTDPKRPLYAHWPFSPAVDETSIEVVSEAQARAETMILGLRLTDEGVSRSAFSRRFGKPIETYYEQQIRELVGLGLIETLSDRVRLTAHTRLVSNRALCYFV